MKCGVLLPQPIPETTTVFSASMPSSAIAFLRVIKMPKSPQPGHQVGFSSFDNSFSLTIRNPLQSIVNLLWEKRPAVVFQHCLVHVQPCIQFHQLGKLPGLVVLKVNCLFC